MNNLRLPDSFSMTISHRVKSFHELTIDELYEVLKLRSEVFVVEQNCMVWGKQSLN